MPEIPSVEIVTPDGKKHRVQVNSKSYDKYLAAGGKITPGSEKGGATTTTTKSSTSTKSSSSSSSSSGLQTFEYVDKNGNLKRFQAKNAAEALANMPADANPKSGVQLVQGGSSSEETTTTASAPEKTGTQTKTESTKTKSSSSSSSGSATSTQAPKGVKFTDTDAYKALSPEEQEFVNMGFNLILYGGEEEAKMFANAIEKAKGIADPYFRAQLTLATGEIGSAIAMLNLDYESAAKIAEKTRDRLLEDVAAGKDFLSLEQQADLAREARFYDEDLLRIADSAAERGLTFGTGYKSRRAAEERRTVEYEDVIESKERKYNFEIAELERRAQRGEQDAADELARLNAEKGLKLSDIGRNAEQILGSSNLGNITSATGYSPVGGVIGSIEEDKRKSIISDIGAFVDLQKGFI